MGGNNTVIGMAVAADKLDTDKIILVLLVGVDVEGKVLGLHPACLPISPSHALRPLHCPSHCH